MKSQPEGLLCLFGKGATWAEIRTIWLWGLVAYKLVVSDYAIYCHLADNLGEKTGENMAVEINCCCMLSFN